jgi:hypothetical protein
LGTLVFDQFYTVPVAFMYRGFYFVIPYSVTSDCQRFRKDVWIYVRDLLVCTLLLCLLCSLFLSLFLSLSLAYTRTQCMHTTIYYLGNNDFIKLENNKCSRHFYFLSFIFYKVSLPRLSSNSPSLCLSLPSAGITSMCPYVCQFFFECLLKSSIEITWA